MSPTISQEAWFGLDVQKLETALLKVKNDILMSMNEQHVTLLVLLDLSAAFDTIHHDKQLIGRLESDLGITDNALARFKSYLSDRF